MNNAVEMTDVCKSFKDFSLQNVRLALPEGYIMGLVGPNGSGKTTLIKLILNMLKMDSGCIQVLGRDVSTEEEAVKEYIGVVFDQFYYLDSWTLVDLERIMRPFYKSWSSQKFSQYLHEFGLNKDHKIKSLSKGMKLKLMMAAALSHETKLLILDEPTGSLDILSRNELLDILSDYVLAEDRSVLFSTHHTPDLERIADYVTVLSQGQIVFSGIKDDLMERYCIIKGLIKDLREDQMAKITGLTLNLMRFEGLYPVREIKGLSSGILTEPASLDDFIRYTNKIPTKGGR